MAGTTKGTPRKRATKPPTDALLASVLAAPTSAEIARLLGKDGKQVRNFVRATLGVYVSGKKGEGSARVLTDEHKRAMYERFAPKAS